MRKLQHALWGGMFILALGIYIEVPGIYRVLTPKAFGMTEIAPRIFIDDPREGPEVLSLLRKARTDSAGFFGSVDVDPRTVICTTRQCAETFAIETLGLAVGYHLVLIAPRGVNIRTLTHERAHIDLHAKMGLLNLARRPYPYWFDEGLASHVAGDNRLSRPANPRDADWVRAAQRLSQWNRLSISRSPQQVYGAAARLVEEIEDSRGRGGLKNLIEDVAGGADFTTTYEAMIRR